MDGIRIQGRFQAIPQTLSDGEDGPVQVDNTGRLVTTSTPGGVTLVAFDPPLSFNSIGGGLATSGVIRASPGTLLDVNGYNASGETRFFQLFNTVAVPPDTTVPATIPIEVAAGTHFSITFADSQGQTFSTGITWASSTTQLTKTITGAADMIIEAGHRPPP